jgi:iron(III) transport system substrate-binding protein
MRIVKMTIVSFILLMIALPLYAGGRLTYYCSTDMPWCELMKKEFEKRTGIRVSMTRASSGETLTKIRAEKSNPKGDVWWGGTGDPHLQAAEEGLTQAYNSPKLGEFTTGPSLRTKPREAKPWVFIWVPWVLDTIVSF